MINTVKTSIKKHILHLKVYYYLGPQSLYTCKQNNCFRDVLGLDQFRQYLNKIHRIDNSNSILNAEGHRFITKYNDYLPISDVTANDIITVSNFIFKGSNKNTIDNDIITNTIFFC